ncbi:cation diffusion facilitator family transporter [Conexibacter sp. JD483]|uniref:cation diffusion facilitator family transporter n=1 Tax=unclassified Conexibacter TaxID=2627773 RepID=UPI002718E4C9|nr:MULTISPECIES: cation diffusion facilitator family transporter [unclassified Conexibacter]MDO8187789.1 cation diffusion facilitator family transporter [Conexibacter sp. CPCC 205706]MDO8201977.1 cation diffusion facilitator family transporter [Conexibacter sp. CPCC 205762]MDR9372559.1 cation diffusion facilitator family transporter [Conexibacter sp. JD483]
MTLDSHAARRARLTRLIALSIAAAILTIGLKTTAWLLTGSVGLLSDAAESVVNLVAALVAFVVVRYSTRPPDEEHAYGHEKADYLSAGIEGALILLAAVTIGWTAIDRLLNPEPIESVGIGVAVSVGASLINLSVGLILINAGRELKSIVLEADGRHLMTDVWTSAGVLIAVVAVALTGWETLDPLIAIAVAANIVFMGVKLMCRSTDGLLDRALPDDELEAVTGVLARFTGDDVQFHALRTRRAGSRAFVSTHLLVPGDWSVQRGHDLAEQVEHALREALGNATVFTHLEPLEDPAAYADTGLDRDEAAAAAAAQPPSG